MSPLLTRIVGPFRLLTGGGEGPAAILWAPALVIGALLLLSPVYLAFRSLGAGPEFWDALLRWRVLELLARHRGPGGGGNRRLYCKLPCPWPG